MKKYILPLIFLTLLSCTKTPNDLIPEKDKTLVEVAHRELVKKDILISQVQIARLMEKVSTEPCKWDFDADGLVATSDLNIFIQRYGVFYDQDDLSNFLTAYGQSYDLGDPIKIIPAWNNFINDVSGDNLGWSVIVRRECGSETVNLTNPDLIEWYFEDELIQTGGDFLVFQTYNLDSTIDNPGWQPPCNGTNVVTMKVYFNDDIYVRTDKGFALIINTPDSIENCFDFSIPNLFLGPFTYTELNNGEILVTGQE
jgi:hypothetical protein